MLKRNPVKIKNPLLKNEREVLMSSASRAKKENILLPKQRQMLYQTGYFDELFVRQLEKIYEAIEKFREFCSDKNNQHENKVIDILNDIEYRILFEILASKADKGDIKSTYFIIEDLYKNFAHFSDDDNEEDDYPYYPVPKGFLKIKRKELGLFIIDNCHKFLSKIEQSEFKNFRKYIYTMMAYILDDDHYISSEKLTADKVNYYKEAEKLGGYKATVELAELALKKGDISYVKKLEDLIENTDYHKEQAAKEEMFLASFPYYYFDKACFLLGYLYETGCYEEGKKIIDTNFVKAFDYFYRSAKELEANIKKYKAENNDIDDIAYYIGNNYNCVNAHNLSLYYLEGDIVDENPKEADYWKKISIDAGYEEDDDNEEDIDYSEGKELTNKEFKELANNPPSWMKVEESSFINSSGKPIEVKKQIIKNKADNLSIFPTSKIKDKELLEKQKINYELLEKIKNYEQLEKENLDQKINNLIENGENEEVEFKASLRWDTKLNVLNKSLELVLISEIVGMLNYRGGNILIGINDDKTVNGIESDINSFSLTKDEERFQNHLSEIIINILGVDYKQYIKINLVNYKGFKICHLDIDASPKICKTKPIKKYGEEAEKYSNQVFVRSGAQTRALSPADTVELQSTKFPFSGRREDREHREDS